MPKSTPSHKPLPSYQANHLVQLGNRIRLARKRRKITLKTLAARMFVDEKTLRRLEKGDPGVISGGLTCTPNANYNSPYLHTKTIIVGIIS